MKTIIINTQKELDDLKDFSEETIINITGSINNINMNVKNGIYAISDNATVKSVSGNATVQYVSENATVKYVSDNATVKSVYGNATVQYVSDNATVKSVYGNATVKSVSGNATVQYVSDNATVKSVYGNATVQYVSENATVQYVSGNATVQYVSDNATVQYVSDNATVKSVSGNATVQYVSGNATVQYVSDNATVKSVYGNATVQSVSGNATVQYVSDNATVQSVSENATVKIYSNNVKIAASGSSVIICQDCNPKINILGRATMINTTKMKYDIKSFVDIYPQVDGKITLYKSVNPETNCDFYTGKIKYEGEVVCPDFKENYKEPCGHGLHLSPLPHMALSYNQGKLLVCEADVNDIVVHSDDITKVRCRKVKVIKEYNPK